MSQSANLYSLFASRFPQDRNACAIENHDGGFYTWDDIDRASARLANLLARSGLPRGTRVAVQVEKSPEALLLYLATLRVGYVFVPLNTAYREAEIAYFIANAEPGIVVCSRQNFSWVSRLAFKAGTAQVYTLGADRSGSLLERAAFCEDQFTTADSGPDELASIIYTSGTTGRSKGAMLSHANLAANAQVLQQAWQWRSDDVLLHALPLFHVHGLFVASHCALLGGSKMIFLPGLDTARIMRELPRVTVFMGVPTYYTRLLAEPGFGRSLCSNVRLFISGSAPLLADTFQQFHERSGHAILERYGMSETGMLVSNPYAGERIAGTVGQPLPGVSVRVVDDNGALCAIGTIGHIQVQGPNVFSGYWRMPEKTREEFTADGYFKTGDVGRFDLRAGAEYLSIVGRSKDLIITGGYNVYPKEIESFMDEMAGVRESAVIGLPHPDFGEAVTAVVVRSGIDGEANDDADEARMITALKANIANYKVPKRIHFVEELPRNTMGKVQKNLLRERFAES